LVGKPLRRWLYQANGIEARSKGIETGAFFSGNAVVIGRRCYINARCFFEGVTEPITIGDDCALGMGVMILTSTHEVGDPSHRAGPMRRRPVTIENGCWLGARAMVLPGVTIGEGCVIGAGAVVTRDCAPHGLYGGVPAKRIKDLPI
jgi:maltose O-acetyltransferase